MPTLHKFKINNFALLAACLVLSACSLPDWLGAGEAEPKLEGERFDVMNIETKLTTDPSITHDNVDLPTPQSVLATNAGNYALAGNLSTENSIAFGESPEEFFNITAAPVSTGDKIIVVDGANKIVAFSRDLKTLWETQIQSPDDDGQTYPAAITFSNNVVYGTTGFGKVAAISASDGKILWETNLNIPLRTAPAVAGDRVFVASADNKTFALDATTGEVVWRHTNVVEKTRKFASTSPVVKSGFVVASYASGEIYGLNAVQGREIWGELLSQGLGQTRAAAGLNDVSATPLIVDGIVYTTNAGGKLVALNLNNGKRIWEQSIAGVATPWVVGRFLFIINDKQQLIALNRYDGGIKWISELSDNEEDDGKGKPTWQGPIMAGGKLLAHNNVGELLIVEPNKGKIVERKEIATEIYATAKVIAGKLYFVTNAAELVELK